MGLAVGLMSGTSLDGVDAALVEIQGSGYETTIKLIDFYTLPMTDTLKQKIQLGLSKETSNVELLCSLNFELAYFFARAVKDICSTNNLDPSELTFVASHGQTMYHMPQPDADYYPSTLQLGESSILAEELKTTIVSDFRYRDMAVGGQGAPIVPFSEQVLYQSNEVTRVLQNIGGIGNFTILPKDGDVTKIIGLDTGPGNMIIDEFARRFFGKEYDANGDLASQGKVNEPVLSYMMSHSYFAKELPKTTGREDFGAHYVSMLLDKFSLDKYDWMATSTAFTVQSIVYHLNKFGIIDAELIVGGGGSYNKTLLKGLQEALPNIRVLIQEDLGFSSDAKEAIAMVILGNQTLHKQPSNVKSVTHARKDVILGKVTWY